MSKYNEVMDNIKVTEDMRNRILLNIEKEISQDEKPIVSAPVANIENYKKKRPNNVVRFIKRYGSMVAIFALVVAGTYGVIRTVGLNGSKGESAATSSAEPASDYAYVEEATESAEMTESAEATEASDEFEVKPGNAIPSEDAADDYEGVAMEPQISAATGSKGKEDSRDYRATGSAASAVNESALEAVITSAKELSDELGFEIKDVKSLKAKATSITYSAYDDGGEITYITSDDAISYCVSSKGSFTGNRDVDITSFTSSTTLEAGKNRALAYGDGVKYMVVYWERDDIWYTVISDKGMTKEEVLEILNES